MSSRQVLRFAWRNAVRGFAVIGFVLVVYHLGFRLSEVVSGSMAPTLQGDERVQHDWAFSERVTTCFRGLRRWEVVGLRDSQGLEVMKRVVGLPGEKVAIRGGKVWVNGAAVEPPASLSFLYYYSYGPYGRNVEVACGEGYFLLGDDSKDSDDSRYNGPIAPAQIRERAWLRVWPPARIGFVQP